MLENNAMVEKWKGTFQPYFEVAKARAGAFEAKARASAADLETRAKTAAVGLELQSVIARIRGGLDAASREDVQKLSSKVESLARKVDQLARQRVAEVQSKIAPATRGHKK